jgi:hypothetical protein
MYEFGLQGFLMLLEFIEELEFILSWDMCGGYELYKYFSFSCLLFYFVLFKFQQFRENFNT